MREVDGVRQPAWGRRRWFVDAVMDLAVWEDAAGRVVAFQLAYDRGRAEHVVSWRAGARRLRHEAVDDGECPAGRCKRAPLLLPDGPIPRRWLRSAFVARSDAIDAGIRRAVLRALGAD